MGGIGTEYGKEFGSGEETENSLGGTDSGGFSSRGSLLPNLLPMGGSFTPMPPPTFGGASRGGIGLPGLPGLPELPGLSRLLPGEAMPGTEQGTGFGTSSGIDGTIASRKVIGMK